MCVHCNREKEEDLEKRQFFINRELRPLMEIPGWILGCLVVRDSARPLYNRLQCLYVACYHRVWLMSICAYSNKWKNYMHLYM